MTPFPQSAHLRTKKKRHLTHHQLLVMQPLKKVTTYHQLHAGWLYQVWHRTVHKWIFQHGAYQHFRWSACWPAADLGARWPAPHDLAPFDPANLKLRRRGTRKQRQIDFRFLCPGRRRRLIWLDFVVWRELLCLMDCLFELQPLWKIKKIGWLIFIRSSFEMASGLLSKYEWGFELSFILSKRLWIRKSYKNFGGVTHCVTRDSFCLFWSI